MKTKTCKICGVDFQTEGNKVYYCPTCREKAKRDRNLRATHIEHSRIGRTTKVEFMGRVWEFPKAAYDPVEHDDINEIRDEFYGSLAFTRGY